MLGIFYTFKICTNKPSTVYITRLTIMVIKGVGGGVKYSQCNGKTKQ